MDRKNTASPHPRTVIRGHHGVSVPATPTMLLTAAAAATLLGASPAQAAALGAVTVQSALGEPLRAEIQVPQLSSEEAASFNARMAPPGAFAAAGVSYDSSLAGATVTLQRRGNGAAYLRVTTSRPINEPVLGMVIQADWASGQLTRDYTMLLDPPGLPPAAATAPPAPAAPAARTRPPVSTAVQVPQVAPAKRPAPRPAAAAPASTQPAPAPASGTPGRITVRSGDTASGLAVAHGLSGVSLDQMLLAMLRANPNAFIDGNVNLIKAGAVIQMPTAAEAQAVSRGDARRLVVAQTSDFDTYRSGLARNVQATQETPSTEATEGQLQTQVAAAEDTQAATDRLEISKEGSADAGADDATDVAQARQAQEQSDRVAELDRNISELSDLQQQIETELGGTADGTEEATDDADPASAPTDDAETTEAADSNTADDDAGDGAGIETPDSGNDEALAQQDADTGETAADGAEDTEDTAPAADLEAAPDSDGAALADIAASDSNGTDVDGSAAVAVDTAADNGAGIAMNAAAPAAEAPQSLLDQAMAYRWPIVAVLVALLALLGLGRSRQRRQENTLQDQDTPFAPWPPSAATESAPQPPVDTAPPTTDPGAATAAVSDTLDRELDSTPATDDAFADSAFQLTATESDGEGASDPVLEADIYMQYGHDDRALQLLQTALEEQPERVEIYEKLGQIHVRAKDSEALQALAQQARRAGATAAVSALTRLSGELEPQIRLSQDAAAADGMATATDTSPDAATLWQQTEKSPFPSADEEQTSAAADFERMTLDFDLDLDLDSSQSAETDPESTLTSAAEPGQDTDANTAPPADTNLMAFNLDDLTLELPETSDGDDNQGDGQPSSADSLALARQLHALGDRDGARRAAEEIAQRATGELQAQARALLKSLDDGS